MITNIKVKLVTGQIEDFNLTVSGNPFVKAPANQSPPEINHDSLVLGVTLKFGYDQWESISYDYNLESLSGKSTTFKALIEKENK